MISLIMAMTPPGHRSWDIGARVVIALLMVVPFVVVTRVKNGERDRRAGLGILAVVAGPFVGACLAWSVNTFGEVHPLDHGYNLYVFIIVGSLAGVLCGVAFTLTGLLAPSRAGAEGLAKEPHPEWWDEP